MMAHERESREEQPLFVRHPGHSSFEASVETVHHAYCGKMIPENACGIFDQEAVGLSRSTLTSFNRRRSSPTDS
jgi:hypothetical protein